MLHIAVLEHLALEEAIAEREIEGAPLWTIVDSLVDGFNRMLKRLEREACGEFIEISQRDGTVKRFAQSEGMEALLSLIDDRDHPLAEAARNSPDPEWSNSFYSASPIAAAEDLSE